MADETRFSALRWAFEMTNFWEAAAPNGRFPVDVELIATAISRQRYPKEPIRGIEGGDIAGFEGALYPLGTPRDGWAIIYNKTGVTPGRKRFTIAHEFGHYLAHRHLRPEGMECDERAVTARDGEGIEKEADQFAANLLMPLDDYRSRVSSDDKAGIEEISAAAERYGVSFIAAALRWIEYTNRRAVFIVSRDGGALWARSSEAAFKSGRFVRTKRETFMLPEKSLAALGEFNSAGRSCGKHEAGVWFPEATEELSIHSRRHDLTLTILHLPTTFARTAHAEPVESDTYDRFTARS